VLRQTLAIVGTPEAVVSAEPPWTRTSGELSLSNEAPAPQPPPINQQPPQHITVQTPSPVPEKKSRTGCWVALTGVFLFTLLGVCILGMLILFSYKQMKKAAIYADEKAAITATYEICDAERRYIEEEKTDQDGDGVPDYGTMLDLYEHQLILSDYSKHVYANYLYHLRVTPSAKTGTPSFVCEAVPLFDEYDHTFEIDQTREIRTLSVKDIKLIVQDQNSVAQEGAKAPWAPVVK
jgi:hypothetical protein